MYLLVQLQLRGRRDLQPPRTVYLSPSLFLHYPGKSSDITNRDMPNSHHSSTRKLISSFKECLSVYPEMYTGIWGCVFREGDVNEDYLGRGLGLDRYWVDKNIIWAMIWHLSKSSFIKSNGSLRKKYLSSFSLSPLFPRKTSASILLWVCLWRIKSVLRSPHDAFILIYDSSLNRFPFKNLWK